jgi:hypothetical protein
MVSVCAGCRSARQEAGCHGARPTAPGWQLGRLQAPHSRTGAKCPCLSGPPTPISRAGLMVTPAVCYPVLKQTEAGGCLIRDWRLQAAAQAAERRARDDASCPTGVIGTQSVSYSDADAEVVILGDGPARRQQRPATGAQVATTALLLQTAVMCNSSCAWDVHNPTLSI